MTDETPRESLLLKWGHLKSWRGLNSESAQKAFSDMQDDIENREKIKTLIESLNDPVIILDFYDKKITREEALEYVANYPNDKTTQKYC